MLSNKAQVLVLPAKLNVSVDGSHAVPSRIRTRFYRVGAVCNRVGIVHLLWLMLVAVSKHLAMSLLGAVYC